mmetsp:Transcript_1064/g.3307  ORF Transcript_1064/g.3307 Transcript_1064/m.3307 type:complete len:240 (+) Transcript_1064:69-788(+)
MPRPPKHWSSKYRIRMRRRGPPSEHFYDIVLLNRRRRRQARPVVVFGSFYPFFRSYEEFLARQWRVVLDVDRVKKYLAVGVEPTDTVAKLLSFAGITPQRPVPDRRRRMPAFKSDEHLAAEKAADDQESQEMEKLAKQMRQQRQFSVDLGRSGTQLEELLQSAMKLQKENADIGGPDNGSGSGSSEDVLDQNTPLPGSDPSSGPLKPTPPASRLPALNRSPLELVEVFRAMRMDEDDRK